MTENREEQMSLFDQDIWCGKMCREHSVPMEEKTLEPFLKKRQEPQTKMPLFLDLRTGRGGLLPDAFWEMGGPLPGEFTMRSFGEFPSEERESRLSQIVEATPLQKYSLSAKACQGILRRAESRGKTLPKMLKEALEMQSVSRKELENQGGGKGILIQNEHTGTLSTLNNQAVAYGFDPGATRDVGVLFLPEASKTLSNGSCPGHHNGVVQLEKNEPILLESNQNHASVQTDGISTTLPASMGMGGGYIPMVVEPKTFSDVAACLNAQDDRGGVHSQKMSDPEGNFVLEPVTASKSSHFTSGIEGDVACTLVATDYKEAQLVAYCDRQESIINFTPDSVLKNTDEEVAYSMLSRDYKDPQCVAYGLDRASYNQGKNAKYGFSVDEEKIGAQTAMGPGAVYSNYIVRRLTPMECERLQGFPDGWTDIGDWIDSKGKLHKGESDSPRYKALGNSIALPFWEWMAKRMAAYLPENSTMASLFDGIGGFPLAYSRAGVSPVWASEIEDFPIAVTKKHFKEPE